MYLCNTYLLGAQESSVLLNTVSVDSFCRDDPDMPGPPYIGKACTCQMEDL